MNKWSQPTPRKCLEQKYRTFLELNLEFFPRTLWDFFRDWKLQKENNLASETVVE